MLRASKPPDSGGFCVGWAHESVVWTVASSDERMLAGGGCVSGGCTSAKPRWSEVIVFWASVLRRVDRYPEETGTAEALK